MINFDNYTVDKICEADASGLTELMTSNSKRFHRFFPKTLAQNLTFKNSKKFAFLKSQEHDSKVEFSFVVKDQNPKKIIGLVILKELDWDKKQGEFAYCIDSNHEGKGLTTKAVKLLSQHAIDVIGLEILQIVVHSSNNGSINVAKNCGYKWQKTLLKAYAPPNESPLDMELFELYK